MAALKALASLGTVATTRAGPLPASAAATTIESLWTSRPTNVVLVESTTDQSSRCWLCPGCLEHPGSSREHGSDWSNHPLDRNRHAGAVRPLAVRPSGHPGRHRLLGGTDG